jgi:bacillolysin
MAFIHQRNVQQNKREQTMPQTNLQRMMVKICILNTAFLSCCYSSRDPSLGQPETTEFSPKEGVIGKRRAATDGKQWGKKTSSNTPALQNPSLPVSVVSPGKHPVRSEVQKAMLEAASQSSLPFKVTIDPTLGTVRRFSGRLTNPFPHTTEGAIHYLRENLRGFGLSSDKPVTLVVDREVIDDDGSLHVIVHPRIEELPVWLVTVAIHLDASGNIRAMNAQNFTPIVLKSAVRFDRDAAIAAATRSLRPLSIDGEVTTVTEPVLGIRPAVKDGASSTYAWKFVQFAVEPDHTPQYFETYVDAESGEIAARYPTTVTDSLTPTTGSAVNNLGESETLRISYNEDADAYVLLDQSRGMASGEILTYNANNEYVLTLDNSTLVSSSDADHWDVVGASTHANLQNTVDYYLNTHGRNSWDGLGASVRGIVHYGQQYNNAYWSSYDRQMVFGDGDGSQFVAFGGAQDIVAHEFGHAVVSSTANLIYANQSGALNESFADISSVMVDRENWTEGENAMGPNSSASAIRSLENPGLFGHPAHMSEYQDMTWDHGGVHINCGIPSHAAFLVGSREVVEKVWYRTLNQGHVGSLANFQDMAEGTLVSCDELAEKGTLTQANCDAVLEAWVTVGVLTEASTSGCPAHATEQNGLCYCDDGYVPSLTGNECVSEGALGCPEHSIETNGQCFCEDGYRVPPSDDPTAPMTCEPEENACPKDSSWDADENQCVCNEGFEGNPDGMDGGCTVISSDCPENSHPVWNSDPETAPDNYDCLCNDGFEYDAGECVVEPGGCGNESFYGRCESGTLIYCGPEGIETAACTESDLICGLFDSRIGYDCLNPDGLGAAETCEADGYQECDADNPFCVAEADADQGFCSKECKVDDDCGAPYTCCGTVSDGTRACLTAPYCDNVVDTKAVCADVEGGSAYYGSCDGNVLIYCDGSTSTTQQVNCPKLGLVCRFIDEETGYNCIDNGAGAAIGAPSDWCPYENDGVCDVPDLCPEGSDLFDCNPCGEVTSDGECDDDLLRLCDENLGLVETDCSSLAETPHCAIDQDGKAACVPESETDTDTDMGMDTETADADTGSADAGQEDTDTTGTDTDTPKEEEDDSASCSCNTVGNRTTVGFSVLIPLIFNF